MTRDRLFLLRPGFEDQGRAWFCADCAAVEGFLGYYPHVREAIDVVYVPYPRPRALMIELLGEDHQSLPRLVLARREEGDGIGQANGRSFIADSGPITRYLAARYDAAPPHP